LGFAIPLSHQTGENEFKVGHTTTLSFRKDDLTVPLNYLHASFLADPIELRIDRRQRLLALRFNHGRVL
jgi:hypothetical protein